MGRRSWELIGDILGGCLSTIKDDRMCVTLDVCFFSAAMISTSCEAAR